MFTRSRGSVALVLVDHVPPKKEPEFTSTDNGGGGGSDDYASNIGIDTNDYCDYSSRKEDTASKVIDIYHRTLKEQPELGDDDGYAVVINDDYDCVPPNEEPGLVATGDDTDHDSGRDVGYDCSHCGIGVCSRKFKVEHELRCKVVKKRKELESQVTKLYHCGYCRSPFITKELKEQHQRKYCRKRPVAKKKPSNGPYFGCDKCEYVAKWNYSLEKHFLTHNKNNAEWFTCTQCSYKGVHKSDVTTHMKIHNNTFSYCCSICGKSFRTKRNLDDHLLKQHSDEWAEVATLITSKVYACHICDRFRTTYKTNFSEHLTVTHHKGVGGQKYECPRCPYSTFRKANLKMHSKLHAKQKDYRCSICKKQFTLKIQLHSHILYIHIDNVDLVKTITSKIHPCKSCSFKTVIKTHLNQHVQSKHI